MQAKRVERPNDAVVLLATIFWCADNKETLNDISKQHPDCELILLMPNKEALLKQFENVDWSTSENTKEEVFAKIDKCFDNIDACFIQKTFAWSSTKRVITPDFAGDIIDKTKTSRGYVACTNDAAYDKSTKFGKLIVSKIIDRCDAFNVESY